MKKFFCFLVICFVAAATGFAQTADSVEALLNTEAASYEQAAAFILEAAGVSGFSNPEEAFGLAAERKWLPSDVSGKDIARVDNVSLLVMKALALKGGLFYSLFQNAHYAYRELQDREMIDVNTGPGRTVSGEILLFLIDRAMNNEQ